jgi:6-phosphogluconolactonase
MADTPDTLGLLCSYREDEQGGIYTYRLREDGEFERLSHTAGGNPAYAAVHPDGSHVYTVDRVEGGRLSGFELNRSSGDLSRVTERSSEGEGPAYVSVDATGRYVFVANGSGGTIAAFPVRDDGRVGPSSDVIRPGSKSGSSTGEETQHPHCIVPGPDNRFVYVPDMKADRVWAYEFRFSDGAFRPADPPSVRVPDGTGPRHLAFHPNGRVGYVVNELGASVTVFEHDTETGGLDPVQTIATLPDDYGGENKCADVHVHPSGQWVYASNRGHDSIVVYAADPDTGRLDIVDHESTRGHWPRDFAIGPDGRFLYVENMRSDSVESFAIDEATGRLSPLDRGLDIPSPICLQFI